MRSPPLGGIVGLPRYSWVALPWLTLASGCATSLSTNQPAHVPEQGHFQTELGFDVSVPTTSADKIIDAAQELEEVAATRPLTEAEKAAIVDGAAYLTLNPPSVSPHAGVFFAPLQNWEAGVRVTGGHVRLSGRHQFLHQAEHGFDLSAGLGAGVSFAEPPVDQVLETMAIDQFSRWTLDVPLSIGQKEDWFRWWGGPRLVFSRTGQRISLNLPNETPVQGRVDGWQLYTGVTAGLAMGYDWIFMGPELTVVGLVGNADVTGLNIIESTDVSSFVVHPSFAVMMEF